MIELQQTLDQLRAISDRDYRLEQASDFWDASDDEERAPARDWLFLLRYDGIDDVSEIVYLPTGEMDVYLKGFLAAWEDFV